MTMLRVYAHHGPIPSRFVTPRPSTMPLPATPPVKQYWCELVAQSTVDSPGAEPGYGQAGAVAPDEWRWDLGYASDAVDFTVTGLCVLLAGTTRDDYDYVLVSPYGLEIPVPTGITFSSM